jgi:hypothetical protein
MIRKITATTLALTVVWTTTWAAAPAAFAQQPTGSRLITADAMGELDRLADLVSELRSQIDRSQFDLEALLDEVDYDADRIIRFVREEIDFEPYSGLLRGAQGTLMSRAGNSLDQSVLLATLLKMAGAEARIAHSVLSQLEAEKLLSLIPAHREAPRPFKNEEAVQRILSKAHQQRGGDEGPGLKPTEGLDVSESSLESQILSDQMSVASVSKDIASQLSANEIVFDPSLADTDHVEESRDYYWVEIRTSTSTGWKTCQPIFSDPSKELTHLAKETTLDETIPAALQHRLSVDIEIQQRLGSKTSQRPIMQTWTRPVANLLGSPISIVNLPDGLLQPPGDLALADAVAGSRFFIPLLNGAPAPGAQAFDRNGNTVPLDSLALGAAGYFAELSDKAGSAASALGALGSSTKTEGTDNSSMSLEAVWITYSIVTPAGEVSRYQRNLLDPSVLLGRSAPADPSGLTRDLLLATDYSMMVAVGEYPLAFTIDVALQRLQQASAAFQAVIPHASEPPESFLKRSADVSKDLDTTWFAQLFLFQLFDDWPGADDNVRIFRHRPNLLLHKSMPQLDGPARTAVDVVANGRRALSLEKDGSRSPAPERLLEVGIWESLTEGSLPSVRDEDRLNAARALIADRASGANFRTFKPGDAEDLASTKLSELARMNVQRDLDNGYVVLMADKSSQDELQGEVWWRVHPSTGETLALFRDGSGADVGGYAIVIGIAAVCYLGAAAAQWQTCKDTDSVNVCTACAGLTGTIALFAISAAIIDFMTTKSYGAGAGLTLLFIAAAKEAGCSVFFMYQE